MLPKISHFVAVMGALVVLASASSMACSLSPADPIKIKQIMAKEIAYRLGKKPEQIPLSIITEPELYMPFGLGADCSGLGALHYSAGFRFAEAWRLELGPWFWPDFGDWSGRWPQYAQCSYEGVAAVLGFGYSSPVAVNFEQKCS